MGASNLFEPLGIFPTVHKMTGCEIGFSHRHFSVHYLSLAFVHLSHECSLLENSLYFYVSKMVLHFWHTNGIDTNILAFLHEPLYFFSTDVQNCSTGLFFRIFVFDIFLTISPPTAVSIILSTQWFINWCFSTSRVFCSFVPNVSAILIWF